MQKIKEIWAMVWQKFSKILGPFLKEWDKILLLLKQIGNSLVFLVSYLITKAAQENAYLRKLIASCQTGIFCGLNSQEV